MKSRIARFTWSFVLIAFGVAAAPTSKQPSSADKAREAIGILKSGAPSSEKAIACKRLAVYGNADAVPALVPLLADEQLAAWARTALEVIPGRAADAALRDAMGRLHGRLLVGVLNSIAVRRDTKAVSGLAAKLKDTDAEVAGAAAFALGRIGGDKAVAVLKPLLAESSPEIRSTAAQGCILCAEQFLAQRKLTKASGLYDMVRGANVPQQRVLEATRGAILAQGRPDAAIRLLLETLRSPDKATFDLGLRTAREVRGPAVTAALAGELGRTPPERYDALLLAIVDRGDEAGLPVVVAAAKSGSKATRLVAIGGLGRWVHPACVPALLDAVTDDDADIAQAARTCLAVKPTEEVSRELLARLPHCGPKPRRAFIQLAGQLQFATAVPEMSKAANDADAGIRAAGIKALGLTVNVNQLNALTGLLAKSDSAEEISAVQDALEAACTRCKDKAACTRVLVPLLATNPAQAQCALLRVLGAVATTEALDAVAAARSHPEATVRDAAIRVLADWSEPAALPIVLDVWRQARDDSHRFLALRGCVRLLDLDGQAAAAKLKIFGELLAGTQRADDRKVILSGLANIADSAALKLVEPLLDDAEVSAEAKLAAEKISTALKKPAAPGHKPAPKAGARKPKSAKS